MMLELFNLYCLKNDASISYFFNELSIFFLSLKEKIELFFKYFFLFFKFVFSFLNYIFISIKDFLVLVVSKFWKISNFWKIFLIIFFVIFFVFLFWYICLIIFFNSLIE